jgi:hypothetical protein
MLHRLQLQPLLCRLFSMIFRFIVHFILLFWCVLLGLKPAAAVRATVEIGVVARAELVIHSSPVVRTFLS